VFRDAQDAVRFIELNPVSARLLGILQAGQTTGREALEQITAELAHTDPGAVLQHGLAILTDPKNQGAILAWRGLKNSSV